MDSHYNNIFNKKNIEFQLEGQNKSLPHVSNDETSLKENQIIFSAINNVFQKFLDNDLYNEAMLKSYIEHGIVGGPTYVSSINNIEKNGFLGKKFIVSGENGISVLQREIVDVGETLSGPCLSGVKTNRISFINGRYVACTDDGIYSSDNKFSWNKILGTNQISVVDICYNYNFLHDTAVSSFDYLAVANDSENVVFCGHDGINNRWIDFSKNEDLSSIKISKKQATRIFSFEDDSKTYVALTDSSGFMASELKTATEQFVPEYGTNDWKIYDAATIPETDLFDRYLLATNYGLKQSKKEKGFAGFRKLFGSSSVITAVIENGGTYFVATDSGLYAIRNGNANKIEGIPDLCNALVASGNKTFVGTSSGIYSLNGEQKESYNWLPSKNVTLFAKSGTIIFAYSQSDNKIFLSKSFGNWNQVNVQFETGEFVRDMKSNGNDVYIVTNKKILVSSRTGQEITFQLLENDCFDKNVSFAKAFGKNRLITKTENSLAVFNPSNGFSTMLSTTIGQDIIQVEKISQTQFEKYILQDSNKELSVLNHNSDNSWNIERLIVNGSPLNAEKISYCSNSNFPGLFFIDSDHRVCFVSYNATDNAFENLKRISIDSGYLDIVCDDTDAFALLQNKLVKFSNSYKETLTEEFSFENGVSLTEYGDWILSTLEDSLEVSKNGLDSTVKLDGLENVRSGDLIDYLSSKNEWNSVLVGTGNTISAFDLSVSENKFSIINGKTVLDTVGSNAFADAYFEDQDSGLIRNAVNLAAFDDSIYALSAVKKYENQLYSINEENSCEIRDAVTLNNVVYIATENGIFYYSGNRNPSERFINSDFIHPVKSFSKVKNGNSDCLLLASSNDKKVLVSCYISNDGNSWNEVSPIVQGQFDGISSNYGTLLDVSIKTLSIALSNGIDFTITRSTLSDQNRIQALYKNSNGIRITDISGNVYSLNLENGATRGNAVLLPNEEAPNSENIVSSGWCNNFVVNDLSVRTTEENAVDSIDGYVVYLDPKSYSYAETVSNAIDINETDFNSEYEVFAEYLNKDKISALSIYNDTPIVLSIDRETTTISSFTLGLSVEILSSIIAEHPVTVINSSEVIEISSNVIVPNLSSEFDENFNEAISSYLSDNNVSSLYYSVHVNFTNPKLTAESTESPLLNMTLSSFLTLSSSGIEREEIRKDIPHIYETIDGIYYSKSSSYVGWCINADNDGKYLFYNGEKLITLNADDLCTKSEQQKLAFVQIAKTKVNGNFNDLYYFKAGDIFASDPQIRKTEISIHGKEFVDSKTSDIAGNISKITSNGDTLYVRKGNDLYFTDKDNFPKFVKINQLSNVTDFESSISQTVAIQEQKAFLLNQDGSIQKQYSLNGGFINLFTGKDDLVRIATTEGIFYIENDLLLDNSFYKENSEVRQIFYDEDFYRSNVIIGNDFLYAEELRYDFDDSEYVSLHSFSENVVDMKIIERNSQNPILYVATPSNLYKCSFADFNESSIRISSSVEISIPQECQDIKSIYIDSEGNKFLIVNGKDLYVFDNFTTNLTGLNDPNVIIDAFDFDDSFASMSKFLNYNPIIVCADKACSIRFGDSYGKSLEGNIVGMDRLLLGNQGSLFSYNEDQVLSISKDTLLSSSIVSDMESNEVPSFVEENNDGNNKVWTLSGQNIVSHAFPYGSNSTFLLDFGNVNSIFKIEDDIYAACESGLLRSEVDYSYAFSQWNGYTIDSSTVPLVIAFAKNTWIVGLSSTSEDITFDSSDEELANNLNSELDTYPFYQTIKIAENLFSNGILVSDGNECFFLNVVSKEIQRINLEQLENANRGLATLNAIHDGKQNAILGYGCTFGTFNSLNDVKIFGQVSRDHINLASNFTRGTNCIEVLNSTPDCLIGTTYGLKYACGNIMTKAFYSYDGGESIDSNIKIIRKLYDSENFDSYLVCQNNEIFEVFDLENGNFKKVYKLDSGERILDIFAVQKNEYLIATDNGIYLTSLRYKLVDNLKRFTIERIYEIVNEELEKIVRNHIEKEHKPTSFISIVNSKADAGLTFLSSSNRSEDMFDSSIANGLKVVKNDLVDRIEYGGQSENDESYVRVGMKNWSLAAMDPKSAFVSDGFINQFTDPTSNKNFDVSVVPYVVKFWKSGLKEIMIYVPTTGTYYADNPQGMSNLQTAYTSYPRKNVPNVNLTNTLPGACTTLRVYLYNSHFNISTILAAQCVGNSLPLKIYKDNGNADDVWKRVFNTVVQPSALRTLPFTIDSNVNNVRNCTDDSERIYLDFSIYGTDAQAIRIIAE